MDGDTLYLVVREQEGTRVLQRLLSIWLPCTNLETETPRALSTTTVTEWSCTKVCEIGSRSCSSNFATMIWLNTAYPSSMIHPLSKRTAYQVPEIVT